MNSIAEISPYFTVPHPTLLNRSLLRSHLQGEENASYFRGTETIPYGADKVQVTLPQYAGRNFATNYTIQVTPVVSWEEARQDTYRLPMSFAVSKVHNNSFFICGSSGQYDWLAIAKTSANRRLSHDFTPPSIINTYDYSYGQNPYNYIHL